MSRQIKQKIKKVTILIKGLRNEYLDMKKWRNQDGMYGLYHLKKKLFNLSQKKSSNKQNLGWNLQQMRNKLTKNVFFMKNQTNKSKLSDKIQKDDVDDIANSYKFNIFKRQIDKYIIKGNQYLKKDHSKNDRQQQYKQQQTKQNIQPQSLYNNQKQKIKFKILSSKIQQYSKQKYNPFKYLYGWMNYDGWSFYSTKIIDRIRSGLKGIYFKVIVVMMMGCLAYGFGSSIPKQLRLYLSQKKDKQQGKQIIQKFIKK